MRQRIVHVCSAHPVDDGRVFQRACKAGAESGFEVHLIGVATKSHPAGQSKFVDGVHVHALPAIASSLKRMRRRNDVARMAADLRPDIWQVHEPELLKPCLSFAGETPLIFDAHEDFTQVLLDREYLPKLVRPILRFLWDHAERKMMRSVDTVVAATDHVAKRYHMLGVPTITIANYPDLTDHGKIEHVDRDPKLAIFSGSLAENRGILESIEAIAILKKKGVDASLKIAGRASPGFFSMMHAAVTQHDVADRVTIEGEFLRLDGLRDAKKAAIGLVPHRPYGNNLAAWPVKMFDYMALGLPIIYTNLPSHREIMNGTDAGLEVSCKPSDIAQAIESLVLQPAEALRLGSNGILATRTTFNWANEKMRLIGAYQYVLENRR